MENIKEGDICICSKGIIGVVLYPSDKVQKGITFNGDKWQSKNPRKIGVITDLSSFLMIIPNKNPIKRRYGAMDPSSYTEKDK